MINVRPLSFLLLRANSPLLARVAQRHPLNMEPSLLKNKKYAFRTAYLNVNSPIMLKRLFTPKVPVRQRNSTKGLNFVSIMQFIEWGWQSADAQQGKGFLTDILLSMTQRLLFHRMDDNIGEKIKGYSPPIWVSFDIDSMEGKVLDKPKNAESFLDLNAVLEFYSR